MSSARDSNDGAGGVVNTLTSAQGASDNPEAYIARDRRWALVRGVALPDLVRGTAVFADISGFTPLTEALRSELGPQRGAEELTANLDRVFHAVIAELDRFGGNVIYFSGDAITGWIDGDDGRRAVAAGLAMQQAIARVGEIVTPSGNRIQLSLKVAVATGSARRCMVGDPDIQRIDVLAGSLLDDLAAAEQQAGTGEVLADRSTLEMLGDRLTLSERREGDRSAGHCGVVACLNIEVPQAPELEPPPLAAEVVAEWLLPVVYERISTGRGEFLSELRHAYPVFLCFDGLDFDGDAEATSKLDEFVVLAQRIFQRYGGNVLQLTLGDKGAYLYGVFGSPVAHEDDAARAAAAALELIRLEEQTAARDIQIGIAHGSLRSGTYGHAMRRTFVCLGDAVNLAARLMGAAPAGRIFVADDVQEAAGDQFVWEALEPLKLKGKTKPVQAFALNGSLANMARRQLRYELPLVGRLTELNSLAAALEQSLSGEGRVVAISAEAGLGKSRLIAEFVRVTRRRGIFVAFGECQSFGVNTSYFVWREIWRRLLGVEDDAMAEEQLQSAEAALRRVDASLVARAPLLADVIGVSIPDNDLTSAFDAKLRKGSLEDLLATCLKDRAAGEPLVLVLEDCHWIDGLSRDLLEVLLRAAAAHRVLVVLAYRPAQAPGGDLGLEQLPQFEELELSELATEETKALISGKAEQVFGTVDAPDALVELVVSRAEGNPFYAEELLNFIAHEGIKPDDRSALEALDLPDSLHSLVLSRIDALAEDPRRTLKVASVIGRLFRAKTLSGVYPDLGETDRVIERLDDLGDLDLVTLDQPETHSYLFKHVVTQEVSYNSMPFAIRAGLHRRVGEYVELLEGGDLDPHLDLLAHHFWLSDDEDKKRFYLIRAEASARSRYANDAAIRYGERLVSLVDGAQRAEALLNLGKVLELTGDWQRAENVAQEAQQLAEAIGDDVLGGRCVTALAEVARKQGRYEEAVEHLSRAVGVFRDSDYEEGLGLALHVSGTVAAQRGEYDAAREAYGASLVIRERLEDKAALGSLYSNLAIVAEYLEDYSAARMAAEKALALRRSSGDRWGIGVSQNNIGMIAFLERDYVEARSCFEESIRLCREVGDPWMVALALNNLGNATRELGDYRSACEHYGASLEGYRAYDDHWALAFLLEDIGVLAVLIGDPEVAFELLGAATALREEIGSPRSPSQESELAARVAPALEALGDESADRLLTLGGRHTAEQAIERGLAFTLNPRR